jgi:hypothetical protein
MTPNSIPGNLVAIGGLSSVSKTYAKEFAHSALSLVDWSGFSLMTKAALALAALASASEQSVEGLVAHFNVTRLRHRNPDGTTALVTRNPWCIIERGVHIDTALELPKWKELRAGARIGRFVTFGDWATVGEGAMIGGGIDFDARTVVPDGFEIEAPQSERTGFLAKIRDRLSSSKTDLATQATDEQKQRFSDVRVQNALDLVDLVSESLNDHMDDRTIVDIAFDATNDYFFDNSGFDVGDDRANFTVFSQNLARHINPDGTSAIITKSGFGGLGEDVTVHGHAFIGNWAEIGGASEIARGSQTPSHIKANDINIGWTVDRAVTTSDLQDILRRPFLISSSRQEFPNDIAADKAELPSRLVIRKPTGDQRERFGSRRKEKRPPFTVSAALTMVDGSAYDTEPRATIRRHVPKA